MALPPATRPLFLLPSPLLLCFLSLFSHPPLLASAQPSNAPSPSQGPSSVPPISSGYTPIPPISSSGYTPSTVTYNITVTYGQWAPDCVTRQILLMNGVYPGPTISATEGDTLQVTVTNGMGMDALSIHWHGIRQLNTNNMDGTAYVTQYPIPPLGSLTYSFTLDKAGTYMYHGHLEDQVSSGLYGSLIVNDPPSKPFPYRVDGELSVILNDWFHQTPAEQIVGLESVPFVWTGEAQSLLLNGRGKYNCSLIPPPLPNATVAPGDEHKCNASNPQCARSLFVVEPGMTYRFRIASIASLQTVNFAVENHTLTVVAADGYGVQPFNVSAEGVDVYSGQTLDALLIANQPSGLYWVRTDVVARKRVTPLGLAILQYSGAPAGDPASEPPPTRPWNDTAEALNQTERFHADASTPRPPLMATAETYVLINAQQKVEGKTKWAINNISLITPSVPYSLGISDGQNSLYQPVPPQTLASPWNLSAPAPTEAIYGTGYYTFPFNSVVDIVLQNANNIAAGVSEYHPWHMHGHDFWVLAYGQGTFNSSTDVLKYNLQNPPYRNTVPVLPYGWTAIRFVANNPGTWLFHCHLAAHLHMGMAIVFIDGNATNLNSNSTAPPPPPKASPSSLPMSNAGIASAAAAAFLSLVLAV